MHWLEKQKLMRSSETVDSLTSESNILVGDEVDRNWNSLVDDEFKITSREEVDWLVMSLCQRWLQIGLWIIA